MESFNAALGQTLIHSLWQGVMLAAVTGIIVICTRNVKASYRYLLMVGVLILFAMVSAGTFWYQLQSSWVSGSTTAIQNHSHAVLTSKTNTAYDIGDSFPQRVKQYVTNHTQTIVWMWFCIVLARSLQLAMGLQNLSFLRRKHLLPVDELWVSRIEELSARLGIKRMVSLAESGIAKVPMVIGHLKPLILIPAGLLTALPPAEVEAILIHELAHIQRKDYLVNLLQSFLEIIFFFNPGVLWLSALIRAERENCCDDIAVAQTSSKVNYIRALVSCQEYQMAAPAYAMAFPGTRSSLVDRVKRMASGRNHALNVRERSVLFMILLTAGLLTAFFSNGKELGQFSAKTQKAIVRTISPTYDTIPDRPARVAHEAKVAPVKAPVRVSHVEHKEQFKTVVVSTHKQITVDDSITPSRLQPTGPISMTSKPTTPMLPLGKLSSPLKPLQGSTTPYTTRYQPYTAQKDYPPARTESTDIGERVTADLIRDRIINADDKHISFKLSNTELIVNGIKQPDDVQQRYREKFVPEQKGKIGTWTLYNNYDTSTDKK